MKKKMLLGLLVTVPFLTACGSSSNTMKCEYKGGDSVAGYIFTFDGDKLSKMSMYEGIDFDNVDYSLLDCKNKEDCLSKSDDFKKECEEDDMFENCIVEKDDNSITVTGDYTSDALDKNNDYSKRMTRSEVKKQAEQEGLSCK